MSEERIKILYVDDEIHNLNAFKALFRREYDIFTAESAEDGMKLLKEQQPHIILTDQRMPVCTGIEFLEQVIPLYPDPIRVLVTGYSDINAVIDSINKGQIFKYIPKPWKEEDLRMHINNAYEVFRLRKENKELTAKLLVANEQLEFLLRQKLLS
ncbi:MAG: response regulator [Bacteroidia bacterium]|nr:response regulator [Bacteroidia bacterium]